MPQLDKVTFYLQYSSMIWSYLLFHYAIKQTVFRTIFISLRVRELFAEDFYMMNGLSKYTYYNSIHENCATFIEAFNLCILFTSNYFNIFNVGFNNKVFNFEKDFFKDSYIYVLKKNLKLNLVEFNITNEK